MLIGAFSAFAVGFRTGSPALSLAAGAAGGLLRSRLRGRSGGGAGRSDPHRDGVEPRRIRWHRVRLPASRRHDGRGPSGRDALPRVPRARRSLSRGLRASGRRPDRPSRDAAGPAPRRRRRESRRPPLAGDLRRRGPDGGVALFGNDGGARRGAPRRDRFADVRRGDDLGPRLPRARPRRLRAVEAAPPPSGLPPDRRRVGPSGAPAGRGVVGHPVRASSALPALLALSALAISPGRGGAPKALGAPAPDLPPYSSEPGGGWGAGGRGSGPPRYSPRTRSRLSCRH